MILTRDQVLDYFPNLRRPNEALFDQYYWCPTYDWLKELYRNYQRRHYFKPLPGSLFKRLFRKNALWVWQKRNDCDNFSLRFLATSMELFEWTDPEITGEAQTPAVFEIAGDIGSDFSGHAMGCALYDAGGDRPLLRLIETQKPHLSLITPIQERVDGIKYARG